MPHWLQALDEGILLWLQESVRCPLLDAILIPFTTLGNAGLLWITLAVLMLCFKRTRKMGLLTLLALLVGLLLTNLTLKPLAARPRPWLSVAGLIPMLSPGDPYSFPSGHTTAAFAAAGVWCRMLSRRRAKAAALLPAVVMGFSRLYAGVHFPSDVLGGLCVGLLGSQLVCQLAERWQKKRGSRC